jgi:hypothetical protein
MKKTIFTLTLLLFAFIAFAQENHESITNDYDEVEQYVLKKLQIWQQKGKFEPSAEYEKRVSVENQNKQVEMYSTDALKLFPPKKIRFIGVVTVGDYNPDKQTFSLKIPNTKDLELAVPVEQAPEFENNWKNYYFTNVRFGLFEHQYVIYSAEIIVNNKIYTFNAEETTDYGKKTITSIGQKHNTGTEEVSQYSRVVNYIHDNIEKWKIQGEFETSDDFVKRVSAKTQKEKEKSLTTEALNNFASEAIDIDNITLGKYIADNQKFPLVIEGTNTVDIFVPINLAPEFKKNWNSHKVKNVTYGLYENKYVVNTLLIEINDSSTFNYNAILDTDYGNNILLSIDMNNLDTELLDFSTYRSLVKKNTVTTPPDLSITDLSFIDSDGNKRIDADENVKITFTLTNSGKGVAYDVQLKFSEIKGIRGLFFDPRQNIGNLTPSESKEIVIPIDAGMSIASGKANFKIEIVEANGFDCDSKHLSVEVKEFMAPNVVVADKKFATKSGGKIELGKNAILKIMIQNRGLGTAKNVSVRFINPINVLPVNQTKFTYETLLPNESKAIDYEFMVNKRYEDPEIAIEVKIVESYGKYGDTQIPSVSLEERLAANTQIDIVSNVSNTVITNVSLTSDVDKDVPDLSGKFLHPFRYALIFGNEDYSSFQEGLGSESNVDFAASDAQSFANYANKILGVPKENIMLEINADNYKMKQRIEKLIKYASISDGKAELIFYYSGHGFPDEKTKEGYIVPVNVTGANVQAGIKLSELYQTLTSHPVARVTVYLDACFSGGGRNQGLLAAKGVKIKPKENLVINGKLVVFSASSDDQVSLFYKEKLHGMFTYFLLKKLKETGGELTYGELAEYIKRNVQKKSLDINDKDQTPEVNVSSDVTDVWQEWKVR